MPSDRADKGRGATSAPAPPLFSSQRQRVDAFVTATFSWRGTLRLHRPALGWDLLRAPANVALAPLQLAVRLLVSVLALVGARRLAAWLEPRPVFLPTAVARRLDAKIVGELLGLTDPETARHVGRALRESPALREVLRATGSIEEAEARVTRAAASIARYSGTRSAVAEITTAVVALLLGALLFRSVTPGVVSMAPTIADAVARETAIGTFPLGSALGGVWYSVFPLGASAPQMLWTVVVLLVAASCVTTFAGLIADPIQARLGIHRRRLLRLIDAVEADLTGTSPRPFAAREHYYARLADIFDAASGVLRYLR
jgi:hypothetical protein